MHKHELAVQGEIKVDISWGPKGFNGTLGVDGDISD